MVNLVVQNESFSEMFLLGIGGTYAFHMIFTADKICEAQPDFDFDGRVFSILMILAANLLTIYFCMALFLGEITHCIPQLFSAFKSQWGLCMMVYELFA